ncbi:ergothioneine biosynthesis protein EgtB [Bordetella sp. LUAb4]|uniref:ergothioneine biosynthesis protein EgtB n=1 Tax=Bordetella sp. LUAb4 TaxID=2843195 RepID=UPI001E601C77|nr:ergothioneine biosynthesis protein EgtB [Bordetella sp. LUAb4]
MSSSRLPQPSSRDTLRAAYEAVRAHSLALAEPLSPEDQCVQSMPDASPTKWHLAHTTWFFETLVLREHDPAYKLFDEHFPYLFNSYYEALGPRHARPERGMLTRPSQQQVLAYRRHVDESMAALLDSADTDVLAALAPMLELGLHHEQQHQELLLTDILHAFSRNPLFPAYRSAGVLNAPGVTSAVGPAGTPRALTIVSSAEGVGRHASTDDGGARTDSTVAAGAGAGLGAARSAGAGTAADASTTAHSSSAPAGGIALQWLRHPGGMVEVGHHADPSLGFAFDNERPRHAAYLHPYAIANRLVTCGEYACFIEDGGYQRPEFWLSDGWATVRAQEWQAPAYWLLDGDARLRARGLEGDHVFGLGGLLPLDPHEPVAQLSLYEAAAYAAWADARLPTEFEWEAASLLPGFLQGSRHVWQWTRSSYDPYPGFKPLNGAAAEYNGKFMVGQLVLRGGSIATPEGHTRPTYRNFFPPAARWQFSGLRLARDI